MSLMSLGPQGRAILNQESTYLQQTPQDLDFLINDLRFPLKDATIQKFLGYLYHYLPFVKYEHNLKVVIASFLNNPLCFGTPVTSFENNYPIIEVFKLITDKKLKVSKPTLSIKAYYEIILKEVKNFVLFRPIENSWKVLPIISGVMLSNQLRDQLYTDVNVLEYKMFFRKWDNEMFDLFTTCLNHAIHQYQNDDIVNLALLSLAVVYKKDDDINNYTPKISNMFIIKKIINLMFDPQSPASLAVFNKYFHLDPNLPNIEEVVQREIIQKPVTKHLNKLSFLLDNYLKSLPINSECFELIEHSLIVINSFNQHLAASTSSSPIFNKVADKSDNHPLIELFWFSMKGLLFSQVLIFQGIMGRFLSAGAPTSSFWFFRNPNASSNLEVEYKQISFKILHSLYYLNFILLSIGQGGFDGYNFIYYLCIEVVVKNNHGHGFENFTRYLIGNYNEVNLNAQVLNTNYITRCKVLFVLGLWENYLQQDYSKDQSFINNEIFQICLSIVKDPHVEDMDLIEASHSVLLIFFSKSDDTSTQWSKTLQYIELLTAQFPLILSANQLSVGIETLGKKALSKPVNVPHNSAFETSGEQLLEYFYFKCANTPSGIPITRSEETAAFTSAQPIAEVDATSTLSQIDNKTHSSTDIVDRNKRKKPKDHFKVDLVDTSTPSTEYQFAERMTPITSRESMLIAFFNLIPYFPMHVFTKWLERIWSLVMACNQQEQQFLVRILWKVLSENLDLNRCELAYRWWYETMELVQKADSSTVKL